MLELLLVVAVLCVLAAAASWGVVSATTETKESALDVDLRMMRQAIQLYALDHQGLYPGARTAVPSSSARCNAPGKGGTGHRNTAQALIDQLSMATDVKGHACSLSDRTTFKYGPYLRRGIPAEPITGKGSNAAEIAMHSSGAPLTASRSTGGWSYDTASGQIMMNSRALDSAGIPYYLH